MLKRLWRAFRRTVRDDPLMLPLLGLFPLIPFAVKPTYEMLMWLASLIV